MEKGTLPESKQTSSSGSSSRPRTTKLFNFLSFVAFLLLTYTTAESAYRSRHQLLALAFAIFSYADLVLLYHCLRVFERLGPDATPRKKRILRALIWFLATALSLAFTWRVAAAIPPPIAVAVWLVAGSIAISGFYLLFFVSEAELVEKGGINYSAVVNEELPPSEKV